MLFDLSSPRRKNLVRVVYSLLALLLGAGLILGTFGSGGGGLLDSIGLGGGGSTSSGFENQIQDAEKAAEANPQDAAAQLELARIHFLAGNQLVDAETGAPSADSLEQFQKTADAWDAYLKLIGGKEPNSDVATLVAQAYIGLAETATQAGSADTNIKGAAEAQQIVADARPSQGAFGNLAIYLYFAGETARADAAAAKAAELAGPQGAALTKQLDQLKAQAKKFRKQVDEASKPQSGGATGAPGTTNPFQNPLEQQPALGGGLGG